MLDIHDNKLYLYQKKSEINGSEIRYYGCLDVGSSNGFPFRLGGDCFKLNVNPLLKTFVSGKYKNTGGAVNRASLLLEGRGFTQTNLKKHFYQLITYQHDSVSIILVGIKIIL